MYHDKTVKTVEITYDRIGSISVDKICRDGHKKNICYLGIHFEGTTFKTEEEFVKNIYNCRGAFPNLQKIIYTIVYHPQQRIVTSKGINSTVDYNTVIVAKQWEEIIEPY